MARCAMRSGNAVVKCAHSAPAQTDFGFTCSVRFLWLSVQCVFWRAALFWLFRLYRQGNASGSLCLNVRWKTGIFAS